MRSVVDAAEKLRDRAELAALGHSLDGHLAVSDISHKDLDHEPLKQMIESGQIEVQGDGPGVEATHERSRGPSVRTRGHHPATSAPVKGDR